ncbi:hypothetical protein EYF80_028006 [Liparis tanakae]|uniref:Uncharacterized protein n=1 Tax=Liparis tanakae TaxID=230148 RepID=A0A4Z2HA73_9TELE|nr:hypothetical protein EYF80_028006 [Liparis tanakae]
MERRAHTQIARSPGTEEKVDVFACRHRADTHVAGGGVETMISTDGLSTQAMTAFFSFLSSSGLKVRIVEFTDKRFPDAVDTTKSRGRRASSCGDEGSRTGDETSLRHQVETLRVGSHALRTGPAMGAWPRAQREYMEALAQSRALIQGSCGLQPKDKERQWESGNSQLVVRGPGRLGAQGMVISSGNGARQPN